MAPGKTPLLLSLLACACVVQVQQPAARQLVVNTPPPEPLQEQKPERPSPSASWIAGSWHWNGVDYVWLPGHWVEPPRGKSYVQPRYLEQRGRYLYQPGGWQPSDAAAKP